MLFITHTEVPPNNLRVLSGILLDQIGEAELTEDVFQAFVVSTGRVFTISCERPKYHGVLGTAGDGRFMTEFYTHFRGVTVFSEERQENNLICVAENRVLIVTDNDLANGDYPAFLSTERISAPVRANLLVRLEICTFSEVPDVKALALSEPYVLDDKYARSSVTEGLVLPVSYSFSGQRVLAALALGKMVSPSIFEAAVYHEADKHPPSVGDALVRVVSRINPKNRGERIQFSAVIGTVIRQL
ncbi:MAG: hypothetical protein P4N59_16035 [Negativicutes bacterium]|nr:hypothetical protein [Negativicutes bacterium]